MVAIGGDAGSLRALGLDVIPDAHPGEGPLGGIITALRTFAGEVDLVAVLACDLVHPDPAGIRAVVEHVATHEVDGAAPRVDDWRHLHHAVWRMSALAPSANGRSTSGERAPRRAVADAPDG